MLLSAHQTGRYDKSERPLQNRSFAHDVRLPTCAMERQGYVVDRPDSTSGDDGGRYSVLDGWVRPWKSSCSGGIGSHSTVAEKV